jgi:hypothetical protein
MLSNRTFGVFLLYVFVLFFCFFWHDTPAILVAFLQYSRRNDLQNLDLGIQYSTVRSERHLKLDTVCCKKIEVSENQNVEFTIWGFWVFNQFFLRSPLGSGQISRFAVYFLKRNKCGLIGSRFESCHINRYRSKRSHTGRRAMLLSYNRSIWINREGGRIAVKTTGRQ